MCTFLTLKNSPEWVKIINMPTDLILILKNQASFKGDDQLHKLNWSPNLKIIRVLFKSSRNN